MTRLTTDNRGTMGETPTRKVNKQIMERKRRVRINNCLTELKLLVLQAMKKDTSQFSKMEKADILDMTVEYLRCLQKRQFMISTANNPSSASTYRAGFNQCASEVLRYFGNQTSMSEEMRIKLMDYLSDCLQTVNVKHTNEKPKEENNFYNSNIFDQSQSSVSSSSSSPCLTSMLPESPSRDLNTSPFQPSTPVFTPVTYQMCSTPIQQNNHSSGQNIQTNNYSGHPSFLIKDQPGSPTHQQFLSCNYGNVPQIDISPLKVSKDVPHHYENNHAFSELRINCDSVNNIRCDEASSSYQPWCKVPVWRPW